MIHLGSSVFHLSGRTLTVLDLIQSQASSAHFRLDLLLSDADRNFVLCYLRGVQGVVVLCHQISLQKHRILFFCESRQCRVGHGWIFCMPHRITAGQQQNHLRLVVGTTRIWQHGETSSGERHLTVFRQLFLTGSAHEIK